MPSKLVELEIARPGVFGVNTSASGDVMPKEYSVKSTNLVFADEGYPEARRGSRRTHTTPVTGTVRQISTTAEDGVEYTIFTTETKIYRWNGSTNTDITGTVTAFTDGNWKFATLNGEIFGFQSGAPAIKLANIASGTFVDATITGDVPPATSGSAVTDVISAQGRLWVLDGDYLRYSESLAGDAWLASNGAGFIDLRSSYLKGGAIPVALAEFNGNLIVLAKKHITIWSNPNNPNGTLPGVAAMQIVETIGGVGCIARDSVQYTANDMVFLSDQGITSLGRVVQEKSMPLKRHSDNIRGNVTDLIRSSDMSKVWSVYHESKGVYLFGSGDHPECYMIDLSGQLPDGSYRVTTWVKTVHTMGVLPQDSLSASDDVWANLFIADEASYISRVKGYLDHSDNATGLTGDTYLIEYESAWTPIVEELENYLKFPKTVGVVIKGQGTQTFTVNLAFDYGGFITAKGKDGTVTLSVPSTYGTAKYGTATYGSATSIKEKRVMGFGSGRIIKINYQTTVNGNSVSIQRISMKAKIGKQS